MNRIILFVTAVFLIGLACDESNLLVKTDTPVRVSGLIEAQECQYYSVISPYVIEYQHYATLRFVRPDGTIFSTRTDDSSMFAVSIDTGTYSVILESGHTYPDTIRDIRLVRDTVLDFLLQIDYWSSDTVNFDFIYDTLSDSLGQSAEMLFLSALNDQLGGVLGLSELTRETFGPYTPGWGWTSYRSPVCCGLQMWYVTKSIRSLIDRGIVKEPTTFSVYPDVFPCLD